MIKTTQRLPQGYKELKYIASSGTQYINTGIRANNNTKLHIVFSNNSNGSWYVCGARGSESVMYFALSGSQTGRTIYSRFNNQGDTANTDGVDWERNTSMTDYETTLETKGTKCDFIIKDFTNDREFSVIDKNFTSIEVSGNNTNIHLFALRSSNIQSGTTRVKVFELWQNGEKVADYIPCYRKSDNVIGMYDLVSKTFFTNAGTGTFIAGPEVAPVEVGFIHTKHNGSMVNIDHIMTKHNGQMVQVFEQGFTREQEATTFPDTLNHQTVGKNLKQYQIYGNSEQDSLLPDGYTQLSYIESTGTQYINTGVLATTTSNMKVYVDSVANQQSSSALLLVAANGGASGGQWFGATTTWTSGGSAVSTISSTTRIQTTISFGTKVSWELNGTLYERDGAVASISNTLLFDNYGRNYGYIGKLYSCKIWNNNEIVRDFVPAKNSSDVVGLYDLISDTFYTNAGTGTFTAGPNAPTPDAPVEIVSVGDRTKNLFNKNDLEGQGYYNDSGTWIDSSGLYTYNFVEVKPNTRYFVSGLVITALNSNVTLWDANGQFISRPARAKATTLSFTTTAATKYVKVCATEGSANTCQLEEGTAATSYEPYGYKIPVETSSNLVNGSDTKISTIAGLKAITRPTLSRANIISANVGDVVSFGSETVSGIAIPCKKGETFSWKEFGTISTNRRYYLEADQDGVVLTSRETYTDSGKTYTTVSSACAYLLVEWTTDSPDASQMVVVSGATIPSEYSAYFNQTTNIYLSEPLRKIGDYADYVDFKAGKVVRNVARKLLSTGGFTWNSGNTSRTVFRSNLQFVSDIVLPSSQSVKPDFMSEGFYAETAAATWIPGNIASNGGYVQCITAPDTTIEQFNTLTTGMSLYAGLTTPTEQTVTLPAIPTPKGTAIIDFDTTLEPSKIKIIYKGK